MTAWLDNFEGVPHADRDGSESLRVLDSPGLSDGEGTSGTPCPTKAVLSEVVYGDVRHHRERIDQLKDWCRQWKAKADTAQRNLANESAQVEHLQRELTEAHVIIADLAAKLADREAFIEALQRAFP